MIKLNNKFTKSIMATFLGMMSFALQVHAGTNLITTGLPHHCTSEGQEQNKINIYFNRQASEPIQLSAHGVEFFSRYDIAKVDPVQVSNPQFRLRNMSYIVFSPEQDPKYPQYRTLRTGNIFNGQGNRIGNMELSGDGSSSFIMKASDQSVIYSCRAITPEGWQPSVE